MAETCYEISVIQAMFIRTWRKNFSKPGLILFALIQPIFWITFFGFLFERYPLNEATGNSRYIDYLAPGVLVMTILFGASQSGISYIRDIQNGFLERLLLTPASCGSLMAGKILADVIRVLLNGVLVASIAYIVGAHIQMSCAVVVYCIFSLFLFAWGYSCLSSWLALRTRSQELMAGFIQALNMPLIFTSNILVPSRQMPTWLAYWAQINPLSAISTSARETLNQGFVSRTNLDILLPMMVISALLFMLATYELYRYRSR